MAKTRKTSPSKSEGLVTLKINNARGGTLQTDKEHADSILKLEASLGIKIHELVDEVPAIDEDSISDEGK